MKKTTDTRKDLATYKGQDQIISSFDLAEILKYSKDMPVIGSKIPLLDYHLEGGFEGGELISLSGPPKTGKCHGKGTKVMMYDGSIKNIEDIKTGELLMGDDSTSREILSTTKGKDNIYSIEPMRGENFTCNEEHILCLIRARRRINRTDNLAGNIYEMSLKEYLLLSDTQKRNLKLYKKPVEFEHQNIAIESYFLGLWLGDGSAHTTEIETADREIITYLKSFCDRNGFYLTKREQLNSKSDCYRVCHSQKGRIGNIQRNNLLENLRDYGLIKNKHIPIAYKANIRKVRLEILAGLVDSDGYVEKGSTTDTSLGFIFRDKQLAEDVVYIARSLGFSATIKTVKKQIKKIGFEGEYYRIALNGALWEIPVLLKRKKRYKTEFKKDLLNTGFRVKKLGKDGYYGFTLTGNGRYLLGDFTVTHNTLFAQSLTFNFLNQKYKSLWFQYEVTPKRFLDSFGDDIPCFYLPQKLEAYNLTWLETRIMEGIIKQGIKIVFIDHLHYLFDIASKQNTSLQIGSVIRYLKQIAVKYNIIIFLLCHMKKVTFEKEPSDEDIRDSSLIGSESDTVLIIWRVPKTETEAILKLRYARRSGARDKKVKLVKIDGVLRQTDNE